MTPELPRRLVAEAVGTALLVLFGPGSVVAAQKLGNGTLDFPGLGMVALAFGLVIAVVIYAFGTTSGAHINPAVTVSLAATGRFPWGEVPAYVVAQLVGAVAGGLLILATFVGAADLGAGSTTLADGVSFWRGVVVEAVATFLLVTAIMALAVDRRAPGGWAGLMIGLSVTCAIIVFGPVTGGSLNPARSFGPLVATAIGGGDPEWGDFPVYIIGPLVGGVLAAFAYDAIARPRAEAEEPEVPAQGTEGEIRARRIPSEAERERRRGAATATPERQGTEGDVPGRRR
jgi:glycerol uptake facilitator protein